MVIDYSSEVMIVEKPTDPEIQEQNVTLYAAASEYPEPNT